MKQTSKNKEEHLGYSVAQMIVHWPAVKQARSSTLGTAPLAVLYFGCFFTSNLNRREYKTTMFVNDSQGSMSLNFFKSLPKSTLQRRGQGMVFTMQTLSRKTQHKICTLPLKYSGHICIQPQNCRHKTFTLFRLNEFKNRRHLKEKTLAASMQKKGHVPG